MAVETPAGRGRPAMIAALAQGAMAALHGQTPRLPEVGFDAPRQADNAPAWHGQIVLVNLWATWCVPCRKEMPSLAALQSEMGAKDFEVVAISVEPQGLEAEAVPERRQSTARLFPRPKASFSGP